MPLFRPRNPEDAPIEGPGSEPRASDAQLRPLRLTQELLDWAIAALETLVATPQVRDLASKRARSAMNDALKFADHLYPLTLEAPHAAEEGLKPQDHLGQHQDGAEARQAEEAGHRHRPVEGGQVEEEA